MEKKHVFTSIIIIAVLVIASIAFVNLSENSETASISEVEIIPQNPGPGDKIKVVVYLDEGSLNLPQFSFNALFYEGDEMGGGSFRMTREAFDKYSVEIGPYDEGTQIWYRIFISTSNGIIYSEETIDIGIVNYNTDITIFDLEYSPSNLENCSKIEINANFSHDNIITTPTTMYGIYHVLYPDGIESIGGDSLVGIYNFTTHTTEYTFILENEHIITPTESTISPYPSDSIIFYRLYFVGEGYKYATESFLIMIP